MAIVISPGNNNLSNHIVMSKYIKFFALAGAALLLGACQEDLGLETGTITPGNEILFGANAYFENGEPQTRTEYGDIVGNQIEVLWVPGEDRMDIACPQAVGAPGHQAEYMVSELGNDTTSGWNGDDVAGNDKASVLVRKSAVGLQWSTSRTHNFYAAYPSKNQIAERAAGKLAQGDIDKLGMTVSYDQETNAETATLRGFIPVDQSPADENITGSSASGWVVEPDMTYAYMVANASHTYGAGSAVSLLFQPQVTALEFEIVASDLIGTGSGTATYPEFTILGVQLFSRNGKQMAGQFTYTFPLAGSGTGEFETIAANGYEKITQTFGDGLLVKEGQSVKCTFFMLPGEAYNEGNSGDLGLTVIYRVGNNPQVKTASLKKEIAPKKKYFFSNVKLPAIEKNVSSSRWFSALADNIYVSQISIPVASNVFAHVDYGFATKSIQQVQTYTDLWDSGVRGFEFVTRRAVTKSGTRYTSNNTWSLKTAHFVCDEVAHEVFDTTSDDYIDFGIAFETLFAKLKQNPNETLVLICTYQAISDGYDPNGYVKQLLNYFDDLVENNIVSMDDFVQLHANSTVEDIRGKICVIIRPGDDDRFEEDPEKDGKDNDVLYTKDIVLSSNDGTNVTDWSGNVLLIQDWGTAFDVWDRRYEGVAREAQFDITYRNSVKNLADRPYVENLLWGISSSNSTYTRPTDDNGNTYNSNNNFDNLGENISKKAQFKYEHTLSDGGTAYVQEWARVVPSSMAKPIFTGESSDLGTTNLWVNWPESYSEKLVAIDGLFEKSVATKGTSNISNLYINSLSGYYITETYKEGLYPFLNKYYGYSYVLWRWRNVDFDLSNMGKGGDHPALAYDLNKHVYEILTRQKKLSSGNYLNEGPWGLVMMEHIGNTTKGSDDKSQDLVELIMLNNFKFPLATKTTTQNIPPTTPDEGDPNQPGQENEGQGGSSE